MWLILQNDLPDDFVIATYKAHSVKEFCEKAFGYVNLNYSDSVIIDLTLFRPEEVELLVGNSEKAKK